jgi:hypothetical protein
METGEWRPRRKGQFVSDLAGPLVAWGNCDGTTGCTFANESVNARETGPGLRVPDVGGEWGVPGVVSGMKATHTGEQAPSTTT